MAFTKAYHGSAPVARLSNRARWPSVLGTWRLEASPGRLEAVAEVLDRSSRPAPHPRTRSERAAPRRQGKQDHCSKKKPDKQIEEEDQGGPEQESGGLRSQTLGALTSDTSPPLRSLAKDKTLHDWTLALMVLRRGG